MAREEIFVFCFTRTKYLEIHYFREWKFLFIVIEYKIKIAEKNLMVENGEIYNENSSNFFKIVCP